MTPPMPLEEVVIAVVAVAFVEFTGGGVLTATERMPGAGGSGGAAVAPEVVMSSPSAATEPRAATADDDSDVD